LDAELLLQQRGALLVEMERGGALSTTRVTAHQGAPRLLVELIETKPLLRSLDPASEGVFLFQERDQTGQDLLCTTTEAFTIGFNPLAPAVR
jgi:hypothetical protein